VPDVRGREPAVGAVHAAAKESHVLDGRRGIQLLVDAPRHGSRSLHLRGARPGVRRRSLQRTGVAMATNVLALGLDPKFSDFSQMPGITPAMVQSYIDAQLERLRGLGYTVESCLVDQGETAE